MVADALDEKGELVVEHIDLAQGLELGLLGRGLSVREQVCTEGVGGGECDVVDCGFAEGGGGAVGVVGGI